MNESPYPRPTRSYFLVTGLLPLVAVAVAAVLVGMSAITTISAFLATLGAMAAAGTFVMSWEPTSGRSRLQSRFVLWIHEKTPNRFQHWYVPVVAAAVGGGLAEVARSFVMFTKAGTRLSADAAAMAASVGILEGVLVALAFGAGFGLAGFVRPRFSGRERSK